MRPAPTTLSPRVPAPETISLTSLRGLEVRAGSTRLGWVVDVLLDPKVRSAVGLVVRTSVDDCCFLPWPAGRPAESAIEVALPEMLLSHHELDWYASSGVTLSHLLAGPSAPADVVVSRAGRVVALGPRDLVA